MRADRSSQEIKPRKHRTLLIMILLILMLILVIAGLVAYSYKSAMDSLSLTFDYSANGKSIGTAKSDSNGSAADTASNTSDSGSDKTYKAVIDKKDDVLYVEIGDECSALDPVEASVGDVTPAAEKLDTGTVGDKKLAYTVSTSLYGGLLKPSKEFTLNYSVVDDEPPLVLWNGSGTVFERGTEFDINDVFGYGDNADPRPKIKVDGKVDMNSVGSYDLHITLTDASGNSTKSDLTVKVADSVPTYTDDYPRTDFKTFRRKNKGQGKSFGIDVSTWQKDIDFNAVKDAGCEFVIIRVGYSVDGTLEEDSYFKKNLKNARAAGLKVGLYMYSYDNSEDEVRKAARRVIELLDGETLDLPIAFDWEDFGHFQEYEMSLTTLNDMYDAFAAELTANGYGCMLYGSKNYLEKVWENTDTRPIWLAHYTSKTDYDGPYIFWQAGNTGRIKGINGDVDLDIRLETPTGA